MGVIRSVEAIFCEAIEIASPEQRQAWLAQACGDDAELRSQVERLLQAHVRGGSIVDAPPHAVHEASAAAVDDTVQQEPARHPGSQIGPYKLLQQIGEGGMGVVYMAEQTEPVHRKVALKVVKPGMDSRQVIARFEAERQALAMMDHVNIARVLDAGTTDHGRPYFVMELIHGVPITRYCDDNHLSPRERLELFVPVCQAIQHAHQKGIIHRDIKPSNVMITLYDGKPVPKVIDFGVAKAIEQTLTERTLYTQYGSMVGTLEYMSPEQAEISALGVDTRSDIYSLGVLLYELLTGSTPLSRQRMKNAALVEILRMIKEEEPPRPSNRLSESGEALASISAQRHMEPVKLTKLVRGELDWIVMKTLEKDRNRRYETANGFAADLLRYLNDEQVQACPPSTMYRFRKAARRNRLALAVSGIVAVSLLLGIVGTTWQAIRASGQRDRAVNAERLAQTRLISETRARREADNERRRAEAKSEEAAQNLREARRSVDDWFTTISQTTLLDAPGLQPLRKKLLEAAAANYQGLLAQGQKNPELRADLAAAHMRLSVIYMTFDRNDDAIAEMLRGLELVERLILEQPRDKAFARRLAGYFRTGRDLYQGAKRPTEPEKAVAILKRAAEIWETFARENPGIPEFRGDLAGIYLLLSAMFQVSDREQSLAYCLKSRGILEQLVPTAQDVGSYQDMLLLAFGDSSFLLGKLQKPEESNAVLHEARDYFDDLSRKHPTEPALRLSLARVHNDLGRRFRLTQPVEAEKDYRRAVQILEDLIEHAPGNAKYRRQLTTTSLELANLLRAGGRVEEAEALAGKSLEISEKLVLEFPDAADLRSELANLYRTQAERLALSDPAQAERGFRRAVTLYEQLLFDFPDRPRYVEDLARCETQVRVLLQTSKDWAGLESLYRQSLARIGQLRDRNPHRREYLTELAQNHNRLGILLRNLGKLPEAESELARAQEVWRSAPHEKVDEARKSAEAEPDDGHRWHRLFIAYYAAGDWENCLWAIQKKQEIFAGSVWEKFHESMARWQLDERAEALRCFRQALHSMHRDDARHATLRSYQSEAASLLGLGDPGKRVDQAIDAYKSGVAHTKAADDDKAAAAFEQAIEHYQSLTAEFPGVTAYTVRLVDLLTKRGRQRDSESVIRLAIAARESASDSSPDYRLETANFCNDLAHMLLLAGSLADAESFVGKALQLKRDLAAEFPATSGYRFHLAHSYLGHLHVMEALNREAEALESLAEAGRLFREIAADDTATEDHRTWSAHGLWRVGDGWLKRDRFDDGRQNYEQSLLTFQQLAKAHPDNRFYRQEQGFSHRLLANVSQRSGQDKESLRHQQSAVEFYRQLAAEVPKERFYRRELAYVQLRLAGLLARDGQSLAAELALRETLALYDVLIAEEPTEQARRDLANNLNDIAWPLVMSPNPPEGCIRLAQLLTQKGVDLVPEAGHIWSTLATARYRAGDWTGAQTARNQALQHGFENGVSQFISAMIEWQLGHHDTARQQFEKACQLILPDRPGNPDLRPLRSEMEALMQKSE